MPLRRVDGVGVEVVGHRERACERAEVRPDDVHLSGERLQRVRRVSRDVGEVAEDAVERLVLTDEKKHVLNLGRRPLRVRRGEREVRSAGRARDGRHARERAHVIHGGHRGVASGEVRRGRRRDDLDPTAHQVADVPAADVELHRVRTAPVALHARDDERPTFGRDHPRGPPRGRKSPGQSNGRWGLRQVDAVHADGVGRGEWNVDAARGVVVRDADRLDAGETVRLLDRDRCDRPGGAIDEREVIAEVVRDDHPPRIEERHPLRILGGLVRRRDDRQRGVRHVHGDHLRAPPDRDVRGGARRVGRIERDGERLSLADAHLAEYLSVCRRAGPHVVNEDARVVHRGHNRLRPIQRDRDARGVPVSGTAREGRERERARVVVGDRRRRCVEVERLDVSVVGRDEDEIRSAKGDAAVERGGVGVDDVRDDRGAAAADLARIDEAHGVLVITVVDGDHIVGTGDRHDSGREPPLEIVLVEDPRLARGLHPATVGQNALRRVVWIDPRVLEGIGGRRRRRALALDDGRVRAVPVAARRRVRDAAPRAEARALVRLRQLTARGAQRAGVGARMWRRREGARIGVGAEAAIADGRAGGAAVDPRVGQSAVGRLGISAVGPERRSCIANDGSTVGRRRVRGGAARPERRRRRHQKKDTPSSKSASSSAHLAVECIATSGKGTPGINRG